MATTHQQRSQVFYRDKAKAAQTPRAESPKVTSIYGRPYDLALSNYFDRREASLRSDRERLAEARKEREQVEAFARTRGISADDLNQALTAMHDHEALPKSQAAIEQRRERTKEALRLEHGGTEQANAYLKRYIDVTTELAKAVPTLVARANRSGASEDPRAIAALAHYGKAPEAPEAA